MREIIQDIIAWQQAGVDRIAVATVLKTWGSAPRRAGSKMAIGIDHRISGSVSGGCVESAVAETGLETLHTGQPQLLHFGVADDTAWNVGLACCGTIDVFVAPLDMVEFAKFRAAVERGEPLVMATIVRGPEELVGCQVVTSQGKVISSTVPRDRILSIIDALNRATQTSLSVVGELEIFVDFIHPTLQLVVVGGGDISIALTKMAGLMGYRTIVIDPRRVFGSVDRFPHADRLIQKWPRPALAEVELSPGTAVAILTHDPKIDDPALQLVLESDAFYIGALGSRKTHAKRLQRLAEMGFSPEQLERIKAPIGLNIGAATPQEIAVSILAEIVAARHGVLHSMSSK